jgi:hypothetical protein
MNLHPGPFLTVLRAEFNNYCVQYTCGVKEGRKQPLFGFDLWLSMDIYKRRLIGSNLLCNLYGTRTFKMLLKGIFQPFELGGETGLIRFDVKY